MKQSILCVMERRAGETGFEDEGFQHFFLFPSMKHIKRIDTYYDPGWDFPGNDSGQTAFYGGNGFQVNCYGRRILKTYNPLGMNFVEVVAKTPTGFTDDTFRPVGIARKGGNWFVITAYYQSSVLYNYLNKFTDDWQYLSHVALDGATYEEHDGLGILSNGHFVSGTGYGYLVEFDESGNVFKSKQVDSSNPVRGAAVHNGYIVTSQQNGSKIYICDAKTFEVIETFEGSSFLNDTNNYWYGTFFLDNNVKL